MYVGQTGRDFKTTYEEHINDIKSNKDKSRYALHIFRKTTIDKIMNILKLQSKGKHLVVYERFHIYKANKQKYYE
jgi:hypothetical protein